MFRLKGVSRRVAVPIGGGETRDTRGCSRACVRTNGSHWADTAGVHTCVPT